MFRSAFTVILLFISLFCYSQWSWVNPLPSGSTLRSVKFIGQTGYCAGYDGKIMKSTDGGLTWTHLKSNTKKSFTSLFMVNEEVVYFTGMGGTIFKTTNGGSNFVNISLISTKEISTAWFFDPLNGMVAGYDGSMYRTANGGAEWTEVASGTTEDLRAVFFVTPSKGFIVAGYKILNTTDGGMTWINVHTFNTGLLSLIFTSPDTGYATSAVGELIKTTDGGTTWAEKSTGTTAWLTSICETAPGTLIACSVKEFSSTAKIIRSTDGGETWTDIPITTELDLYWVTYTGNNTLIIAGEYGVMLISADDGITWETYSSSLTYNGLHSLFFINNKGFACSAAGVGEIFRTIDGGKNWQKVLTLPTTSLLSLYFTSETTGYASGSYGTIIKTTDGGDNWTNCNVPYDRYFKKLCFTTENTGFAVSNDMVIKTNDAGTTWTNLNLDPGELYQSISFPNADTGYILTRNTRIFKTTDGGNTWNEQPDQFPAISLYELHCLNTDTIFISSELYIYRSVNGGLDWESTYVGYKMNDYFFTDKLTGYAAGSNGTILKTTNAGHSWSIMQTDTKKSLYSLWFTNENKGFAAGEYGTLLTTEGPLGTPEVIESPVSAAFYPNPAIDYIIIPNTGSELITIKIFNVMGQLVLQQYAQSNSNTKADLSKLKPGLYFVNIADSHSSGSSKLIKK